MAKLDILREGENQAIQVLENAKKDARRIIQSIPEMIEELKRKNDDHLREVASEAESAVDQIVIQLKEKLREKTERKLEVLSEYAMNLEKTATESLREHILRGGKED
ncbi:MAG: hypothetical protein KAQ97_04200 [Candidatus Fermentibacteraceae bacterium]|nr:hypothetical protein [Candidatus Fermentibacteraceae bacterium]